MDRWQESEIEAGEVKTMLKPKYTAEFKEQAIKVPQQAGQTSVARQVADGGRPADPVPAAQRAGPPRHAGIPGKKKGPEIIRALVDGGGTRNRTRVRR